jgi:hypothetical protein
MLSGSATAVVLWHMFELSGKLLLPKALANNPFINAVSSDARPNG